MARTPRDHALRALIAIGAAALLVAALATAAFSFGLLATRPLIYGEAEVLHEAARIRGHLALYTDPVAGAFDYGPVPTRCFVVYPPLWAWVLSWAPAGAATAVARGASALAWLATLVAPAMLATGRRAAAVAATYGAGVFVVAIFASSGRPDSIALAMATTALVRSVRRGEVDAVAGALFALAFWFKPNELGLAVGAFAASASLRPTRAWRAPLAALALSAVVAGVLSLASHGAWLTHLVASLAQPMRMEQLAAQLAPRALFAFPLAFAVWIAWRARRDARGRVALGGLVGAIAWSVVSLSKVGSASNYWMEPLAGAVVVAASCPLPTFGARARLALAALGAAHAVWLCAATLIGTSEAFELLPARASLVADATRECVAERRGVVLSDNPGVELAANGRVVSPLFQRVFLVERGTMSVEQWVRDVEAPEVVGLLIEGPLERSGFAPPVREAMARRMTLRATRAGWFYYRAF